MSEDFPIEDGIPLPQSGSKKYPFNKVKVGQSFLVPFAGTNFELRALRGELSNRMSYWKDKHNFVSTTRRVALKEFEFGELNEPNRQYCY